MKAIQYSQFGGPEVLELVDLPDPTPEPGQIRVAVRAAGVNPIDWKLRSGMRGGDLPQTTGREVAGVVDVLGEGVSGVAVGDKVFGFAAGGGGAAELALSADYAPIPSRSTSSAPPASPSPSRPPCARSTCWASAPAAPARSTEPPARSGSSAVQLAVARGARVLGTASPGNHDYLRLLGAEPTTYGEGLVQRVREIAPDGVDAALDAAGAGAIPALVELAGNPETWSRWPTMRGAQETGARFSSGGPGTARAVHALRDIGELIESGRFTLPVAQTFLLGQIAEAHRLSETGHVRGKLVLLVS